MRSPLIISLLLTLALAGCETHSDIRVATEDRGAHRWLYYVQADIYYCTPHRHYWHYLPAERRWVETEQLPRHIDPNWTAYQITDYAGPAPYHHRQTHIQKYREATGK